MPVRIFFHQSRESREYFLKNLDLLSSFWDSDLLHLLFKYIPPSVVNLNSYVPLKLESKMQLPKHEILHFEGVNEQNEKNHWEKLIQVVFSNAMFYRFNFKTNLKIILMILLKNPNTKTVLKTIVDNSRIYGKYPLCRYVLAQWHRVYVGRLCSPSITLISPKDLIKWWNIEVWPMNWRNQYLLKFTSIF